MKHLVLIILLVFGLLPPLFAQEITLSETAEISLLTGGPGDDFYTKFGHSAYRINDPNNNFDVVFNYGAFDFDAPNFYLNFAKGKLLYRLSNYRYQALENAYRRDNQSVDEQLLNLSQTQKQALFNFLLNNAKPENRSYLYDYFYDNCATRPRDVLERVLGSDLQFDLTYVQDLKSIRHLFNAELSANDWGSFGINVALGSPTDKIASPYEHMYIPGYLSKAFDAATIKTANGNIPLVKAKNSILESNRKNGFSLSFFWSPIFIFSVLAFLGIVITYKDFKAKKRSKLLDVLILLISGLIGVVLLLLWFATDHTASINNFNILWAFAPNLLFIFFLRKKYYAWNKIYVAFLLICLLLLFVLWVFEIQVFTLALIPILTLLIIRYLYLFSYFSK
jgi:hypothetical protein